MNETEPQDVSDAADQPPEPQEDYYVPDKPPTIEPLTVEGAEDLPDDVKSDEIPHDD